MAELEPCLGACGKSCRAAASDVPGYCAECAADPRWVDITAPARERRRRCLATPQGDLIRLATLLRTAAAQLGELAALLTTDEAARLCDQLEGPSHDLGAVLEAMLETWNRRQGN